MDDTTDRNSPRTLISKLTSSKRFRRSQDDSLDGMRRKVKMTLKPTERATPRTLIKNILDANDSGSSSVAPLRRSQRLIHKSQTPDVSVGRSTSKLEHSSARLTASAGNKSDAVDSFVLPKYRVGRRQVGKKKRKKPTKTAVDAFKAGAEAVLAAGEFLSASESETEVPAAKQISVSADTSQRSYAADSFVLQPYNAGRRIVKKMGTIPGRDKIRTFAKAVDEIKDNELMTEDDSSTDSRSESASVKKKSPGSAKFSPEKGSICKSPSHDTNAAMEASHNKRPLLSSVQNVHGAVMDDFVHRVNLDLSISNPSSKQSLQQQNTIRSNRRKSQASGDDVSSSNYSVTSPGQRTSKSTKRTSIHVGENILQEVESLNDYENHGFSPKLSSTRMTSRPSLSFQGELETHVSSKVNVLSRNSKSFQESDAMDDMSSPHKHRPTPREIISNRQPRLLPANSDPMEESVMKANTSIRNKSEFINSSFRQSARTHGKDNNTNEIPVPTSALKILSSQSSEQNTSTGHQLPSRTSARLMRSSVFQESDDEQDSHSSYPSPRTVSKGTTSRQHLSVQDPLEGNSSIQNKLEISNSLRKRSSRLHGSDTITQETPAPTSASKIIPAQSSQLNKFTDYNSNLLLPVSSSRSLSFQEQFSAQPAPRANEHSMSSRTNKKIDDEQVFSSPRRSSLSSGVVNPMEGEKGESSVRNKSEFNNSSRKMSSRLHGNNTYAQETPVPTSASKVLPSQSSKQNKSAGHNRTSHLSASPRHSLSLRKQFPTQLASGTNEHAISSGEFQESDIEQNNSSPHSPSRSPRAVTSGTTSKQHLAIQDPMDEEFSVRSRSEFNNSSHERASRLHGTQEIPEPSSASKILPSQSSQQGISTSLDRTARSVSTGSFKEVVYIRPRPNRSQRSEQSVTEDNVFVEDAAVSTSSQLSSRIATQSPSDHERVKTGIHSSSSKKDTIGSHLEDRNTPKSPTKTDLNQTNSRRRTLIQSLLNFSPNNSGKLRYSNIATSRAAKSETNDSEGEIEKNESLANAGRKLKDKRRLKKDSKVAGNPNSVSKNKNLNASRNVVKPSTSQRDDTDDEPPEIGFRYRKRPVQRPSESEAESSDSDKSLNISPKTKKTAKGGQNTRKVKADEEFVPFSGTKANFEHFLQKRVTRPTAIEVQKQVNRFFRLTRNEMDKMMALKPASKKYISPNEVKNMFIEQGLFESVHHLEMNAQQWLDSDGLEVVLDYKGAFQNIKYD